MSNIYYEWLGNGRPIIILNQQMQQELRLSRKKQSFKEKYLNNQSTPLGNYKMIMSDYNAGDPLLSIGPNYLVFLFSFALLNLINVLFMLKLRTAEQGRPFSYLLIVVTVYMDVCWLATALINPGIAFRAPEEEGAPCEDCLEHNGVEIVQKEGRLHCQTCRVCIDERESHVSIVGGCVGKNNFIVFKLLVFGFFLWGMSMISILPVAYNL